ncbi:hypothetical protein [Hymenobacter coccineus]|uniref:Glycosyltransferase RgtA/B/C/D-like domain-containing protein n=1 Tax=Hymenobacter coccineus TaxID=1908235 RepID=A0A1G1TF45_9BACT|nr:hypothetical protein [Hymenobacter coccineus]OGX89490.1 hypothetical protein BEN49_08815 [Hymenobacter coccineus]
MLPWALAVAALANLSYPVYRHYDFSYSPDTRSYLRMATGRFDSVSITRRYRVLVPAAAAALAAPITQGYGHVWPARASAQWTLRFAFYLINCLLLGAAGAIWYNTARQAGASAGAAALAMLALLTSRWAAYEAGLPLTDSLYAVVFGLGYYAFRRGPGAGWAIAVALLLGPLAKESFIFLLPWLMWYGRRALPLSRQLQLLAVGLGALFAVHWAIDSCISAPATESVTNAISHTENIRYSLHRAFNLKGIGELLSIFGLYTLILPVAFWRARSTPTVTRWYASLGLAELLLLAVVAIHMLLSGDLGRMGYLAAPVACTALALVFTHSRHLLRPTAKA